MNRAKEDWRHVETYCSTGLRRALANGHVRKVADLLFMAIEGEKNIFDFVARFLHKHQQETSPGFAADLQSLRKYRHRDLDANNQFVPFLYLDELCSAVEALYKAKPEEVGFRRGAVVELLAYKLINSRCRRNECWSNYRLIDLINHYESKQIDVVVLSDAVKEIEGYECKVKPERFTQEECDNLLALSNIASQLGYTAHVGAISFALSSAIRRELRRILSPGAVEAYGLDNLIDLMDNPFAIAN